MANMENGENIANNPEESVENPLNEILEAPEPAQNALVLAETPEQRAQREDYEAVQARLLKQSAVEVLESQEGPDFNSDNYYKVLGVSETASQADIGKAYRDLAKKYHPDFNPSDNDAVGKFKAVQKAFENLYNPEARAEHDRRLKGRETAVKTLESGNEEEVKLLTDMTKTDLVAINKKIIEGGKELLDFVSEAVMQSGKLENLTGNIEEDAEQIADFFGDYGISANEQAIQRVGAGLYEGMTKQKKKQEGGLLKTIFRLAKEFDRAVERDIPTIL